VLVVFGVMLTAQGPFINMRVNAAEWAIAAAVGLLLYGTLAISLYKMPPPVSPGELSALSKSPLLGESFLGFTEPVRPAEITGVPENVHIRRTKMAYLLPFEIVSVHLLVVLVGAAYLARAKRRRGASS